MGGDGWVEAQVREPQKGASKEKVSEILCSFRTEISAEMAIYLFIHFTFTFILYMLLHTVHSPTCKICPSMTTHSQAEHSKIHFIDLTSVLLLIFFGKMKYFALPYFYYNLSKSLQE